MDKTAYKNRVRELCHLAKRRLQEHHLCLFDGMDKPMLLISATYPGVWLEHVYDALFYATLFPEQREIAENTVIQFMNRQTDEGQLPFMLGADGYVGYSQIQECVSFTALCLRLYEQYGNRQLLEKAYACGEKWVGWLQNHRMTTGRGLIEMFCGYDTGHDNSGRLAGLTHTGNYSVSGVQQNAAVLPPDDPVAPILAVDMNANYYGTLMALAKMADLLAHTDAATVWKQKAAAVKQRLTDVCYDAADGFFYDVDKNGNKRHYLSSTLFHLFMERVLDAKKDAALIERLYHDHIRNPQEFWTPYPFPSMAACDPSVNTHADKNCWGYFSQGLIALRCTLWMDDYGYGKDLDRICERWLQAWTKHFDRIPFGQELDPHTGIPSPCSGWYSSTMLFYIYAAKRLGYV